MRLTRTQFRPDGIFGRLYNDNGVPICYTLEHSYQQPDGSWLPKLPNGQFLCVRGPHRLENMTQDFDTFEITGIPSFMGNPVTGVLFHAGNWDKDSHGCVLLGHNVIIQKDQSQMITSSKVTFSEFMDQLVGVSEFMLTVNQPEEK